MQGPVPEISCQQWPTEGNVFLQPQYVVSPRLTYDEPKHACSYGTKIFKGYPAECLLRRLGISLFLLKEKTNSLRLSYKFRGVTCLRQSERRGRADSMFAVPLLRSNPPPPSVKTGSSGLTPRILSPFLIPFLCKSVSKGNAPPLPIRPVS